MNLAFVGVVGTRKADGFSFNFFKHWIEHYLKSGFAPASFRISLTAADLDDNMQQVAEWLEQRDIAVQRCLTHVRVYNPFEHDAEYHRIKAGLSPDTWVVYADADEIYEYPEPVYDYFKKLDAQGIEAATGYFVDRVAADFSLPEVTSEPLFEQFPLETALTRNLCGGNCDKVCGFKNRHCVEFGHHHVIGNVRQTATQLKVHHFKWTAGLRERSLKLLGVEEERISWKSETRALLDYISEDGKRLLVTQAQARF